MPVHNRTAAVRQPKSAPPYSVATVEDLRSRRILSRVRTSPQLAMALGEMAFATTDRWGRA